MSELNLILTGPPGAGTCFIWDTTGHAVTNYHVVRGANRFVISSFSG